MTNPGDPHDMDKPDSGNDQPDLGDVPVDQEPLEVESPRRAASAQFVVNSNVGSEAALREAMDPANQSLAEALRLSFRVLQMVILVLVVLFFVSGFKTIGEGQSGVLTRSGKIVPVAGQEALSPGLHFSRWPYPVGEFVVFDVDNREVTLRETYWPDTRGRSIEQAAEDASSRNPLQPGAVGYVLTRDGDIAHIRVSSTYEIDGPVDFATRLRDADADRVVRLALMRATVQASATMSLQEIVDLSEELRELIRANAQDILTATGCGIRLVTVNISETTPPLAIVNTFGEAQSARVESERIIDNARQSANQRLVSAAGERYTEVIRMINRYEDALQTGDEDAAATLLVDINATLDGESVSGEVAQIIQRARAYRAQVETTLGNEARRFASLRPAFQEHPDLVVRQRWLRAYSNVLDREDAEVYFVPQQLGMINLELNGLHEIKDLRQKLELDRKEEEALRQSLERQGMYIPWARDLQLEGPGRQLRIEDGRARSLRQPGTSR